MENNLVLKKKRNPSNHFLLWIFRIAAILFAVIPMYGALIIALTPYSNLMEPLLYPKYWAFANFVEAFNSISRPFINSFVYSLLTVSLVLLIAIPASYTITRFSFPGRKVMLFLLLWTQMLAGIIVMPSIYTSLIDFGLSDKVPTLIFILTGVNLSMTVWLLVGFFSGLPKEIEEAALIDGVGIIKLFTKIIVPISTPGIAVAATFAFIGAYNDFVIPLFVMTSPEKLPLTMRLNSLISEITVHWHILAAGSLIGLLPPLLLFFAFQRYIIGGITSGAVKG